MGMARAVEDWLSAASNSIAPTKAERRVAQRAHEELRKLLRSGEMDRRIVRSYLSGSYVRRTAVRPLQDVDIVFEIDPNRWRRSDWAFLGDGLPKPDDVISTFVTAIRSRLRDSGDMTRVRKQGRSVGVMFDDIHVDVVPAVPVQDEDEDEDDDLDDDGSDEDDSDEEAFVEDGETEDEDEFAWEDVTFSDRVKIPDRHDGSWLDSNPRAHVRIASALNGRSNGLFKPTVRLMKAWNAAQGCLVSSFVMETLVAHAFDTFDIDDLSDGLWTSWEFIATRGGLKSGFERSAKREAEASGVCLEDGVLSEIRIPDLAGTGDLAESCDEDAVKKLVKRARRACETLDTAVGARSVPAAEGHLQELLKLEWST